MNPNVEPFTIIQIDGSQFGTGLQLPANLLSSAPEWEESGLGVLSRDTLVTFAKNNDTRGKPRFDKTYIKNQRSHGCHDNQTEVLTSKGFVKWGDYNWLDEIATVNPYSGRFEMQIPTGKHVYPYEGVMYNGEHQSLDFSVTPNHRMYVRKWNERNRKLEHSYRFTEMSRLGWYSGLMRSPNPQLGIELESVSIPGGKHKYTGDDFIRMLALIISDGWVGNGNDYQYAVSFCNFRSHMASEISEFASRNGFCQKQSREGVFLTFDQALWRWLRSNTYTGAGFRSPHKRIPDILYTLSERQIRLFLLWFRDSHTPVSGDPVYYSSSKTLIDGLQNLLLRTGQYGGICTRVGRSSEMSDGRVIESDNIQYQLSTWSSSEHSITTKKNVRTDYYYKGNVYCATVPNGTIITRRNDKVLISGNSCQGFMSAGMLTRARVRRGLPRVDLSGAYVYSKCNGGRDRGSTLDDGMQVVLTYGSCKETTVGWDAIYPSRYDIQKADSEAAEMKAFECYTVREELQLFTALAMGFDCGVAVHADNGFMRLDNRKVAQGGNGPGNHAVGVDGYWTVDGELIADMYNSWDLVYGDEGRAGVTWLQHLRHTTQYHPFYAIRSTIDGSGQENPPAPFAP